MPCVIAAHAGYCAGVRKAMETAHLAAEEALQKGVRCYSLGALIHNPQATAALEEKGVRPVSDIRDAKSGIILLRSHGVSPEVYAACEKQGLDIRDCTCSYVKALHKIVAESQVPVLLIGEKDHPEVQATAAWCQNGCTIIQSEEDARALPPMEAALCVCQTTFPMERWESITKILVAMRLGDTPVLIPNTMVKT